MEKEFDNIKPENNGADASGREGYSKPSYTREYSSEGRPQRQRTRIQRPAYGSDRPHYNTSNREEGGFRPEGFGAGLQDNSEQGERRQGYGQRPRYNNGGYNQRPQGGYRPRYNDNEGGYGQNEGGYGQREGGYGQQRGGYGQQRGGYGQQRQGGYGQQRGGYGQQRQGGYRPRTADYNPNAKYSMKKQIEYKEYLEDPNAPIRLNKFLANAGVCSRREADQFIQAGVVKVNGEVVTELGTKVQRTDSVHFHDQLVSIEKKVYVLLNKPKDYVTTSDDPQQRKTVMDLVKNCCRERIYPVGRLDRNTTGVLLFTNDGELASKLTHPKFLKKKIYHVHLDKNCASSDLQQIMDGIQLEDGEIRADAVSFASDVDKKQVGIEIHSGKNRIVRRIFEALGYKVCKLDRVMFAGLTKKGLKRGDWRFLTEQEVAMLHMGSFE